MLKIAKCYLTGSDEILWEKVHAYKLRVLDLKIILQNVKITFQSYFISLSLQYFNLLSDLFRF